MLDDTRDRLLASGDTIVAISTGEIRSAIGVVRVSGAGTVALIDRFFRAREPWSPRRARFGRFGPPDGPAIDDVLVTVFEGPGSYTGEDVAEVSAHGNILILKEIERILVSAGARRAERGEFTLRAVSNGKMDLTQAEAVRAFVEAETTAQAREAFRQMGGAVSGPVRAQRDLLVAVIAELEAGIDFSDDDIEPPASSGIAARIDELLCPLAGLARSFDYGRLLTGGLLLALVGRPNVGKSSIFNRLVSNDRAIVTGEPGTTRDVLTETVAIAGVPVRVADTAGVREPSGEVEAIGVRRSLETAAEADLTLLVLDGSEPLTAEDRVLLRRLAPSGFQVVVNKSDLPQAWAPEEMAGDPVRFSARTGEGLGQLREEIAGWISSRRPADADTFLVTSERQRECLEDAIATASGAATALREGVPHEMALVDLYRALARLGEITGEVTSEDILDRIFSTFCVGK